MIEVFLGTKAQYIKTAPLLRLMDAQNVACTPINDIEQTLAHPQVAAMDMALDTVQLDGKTIRSPGVPINLAEVPASPAGAPPKLGQDTAAILAALPGYDEQRIRQLKDKGVI